MNIKVPIMIQDMSTVRSRDLPPMEEITIKDEEFFLDGPLCKRLAVLDFDPTTGTLSPGVQFQPPKPGSDLGTYMTGEGNLAASPDARRVSVFATVLQTIKMFEEADNLGRPVTWAFNAPQLLIVPRAGEWANAYYERNSHSLQFFHIPDPKNSSRTIYTSMSRDIVAHETAHAILDGIAPHLYDALSPQSLALHEGVADLCALLMAFRSRDLCTAVLNQTKGSIEKSTDFSTIAEELGSALREGGHKGSLRNLLNDMSLCRDSAAGDLRSEPHELCQVLTGALYKVMVQMHTALRDEIARQKNVDPVSASGRALFIAGERFKRMIIRALDYLPPGEVSFADYGRAIIAADQASHPDDLQERAWLVKEFVARCMAKNPAALHVETNYPSAALQDVDFQELVESDWYAYEFANNNRGLLRIPNKVPFEVVRRLDVRKTYFHRSGREELRELIFKVWWKQEEPNRIGPGYPDRRQIVVGSTLAVDWEKRLVRALLTTGQSRNRGEAVEQREDRDLLLRKLVREDRLRIGKSALGPDGRELRSVIKAEATARLMKVGATAKMLHVLGRV